MNGFDHAIELAYAALDIRAPLGKNKLADSLLNYGTNYASAHLGSVWQQKDNPAPAFIDNCHDVLQGGEVPFIKLRAGINATQGYVRNVTGYGGPSSKPTDAQIHDNFAMITNFGRRSCVRPKRACRSHRHP